MINFGHIWCFHPWLEWMHQKWQKDLAPCKMGYKSQMTVTILRGMFVTDKCWLANIEQKTDYVNTEEKAVTTCHEGQSHGKVLTELSETVPVEKASTSLGNGNRSVVPEGQTTVCLYLSSFPWHSCAASCLQSSWSRCLSLCALFLTLIYSSTVKPPQKCCRPPLNCQLLVFSTSTFTNAFDLETLFILNFQNLTPMVIPFPVWPLLWVPLSLLTLILFISWLACSTMDLFSLWSELPQYISPDITSALKSTPYFHLLPRQPFPDIS